MGVFTGIIIGCVFGGAQLFLLMLGAGTLGENKLKIWPFIVQFFCPFAGLLICAWLAVEHLLLCACVIVGILIFGAISGFFIKSRKDKRGEKGEVKDN